MFIGKDLADQLLQVGIETPEKLIAVGSKQAWLDIRSIDSSACYNRLCALEGALQGGIYVIYDYKDAEGYVSLWVGKCNDYDILNNYLSTVYLDEDIAPQEALKSLFISVNKDRACEEELKNVFDEYYNQFEYDFGLSFDEDLRDGHVLEHFTDDVEVLFDGFSYYDTFIDEAKTLHKQFSKCNAAVALYDFKYCGDILESEHKDINLYFLGYVKYEKY